MTQYQCFFTRYVGDVAEFVVIEARDDARALILADDHLAGHPNYASVEILSGDRQVGQIERPAPQSLGEVRGLLQ
jgi:hypothetical protein